jgi:hypothetical protein
LADRQGFRYVCEQLDPLGLRLVVIERDMNVLIDEIIP